MNDDRFARLENKVDRVEEKIEEVKISTIEMKSDLKHHMSVIEQHIAGDNKIITYIEPLIPVLTELAEVVEDHRYRKESKKRRIGKVKEWSAKGGLVSILVGALLSVLTLFNYF